jgi:hypothetical protein
VSVARVIHGECRTAMAAMEAEARIEFWRAGGEDALVKIREAESRERRADERREEIATAGQESLFPI